MNLLQNRIRNISDYAITSDNFRQKQYDMIPYFSELFVKFIASLGNNHILPSQNTFSDRVNYYGIKNSMVSELFIEIINAETGEAKQFLKSLLPSLIDEQFFYLNGNYYTPMCYILDLPLIIKQNSYKIYSLFNPLTFFMKDDICIFTGRNIPTGYFVQLFSEDDKYLEIYEKFKVKYKLEHKVFTEDNIINYFNAIFGKTFNTRQDVINYFESLFFDDYTKRLYESCYNIKQINMASIIQQCMTMDINGHAPNFIDLNYKRVVFLEVLLAPIFEAVRNVSVHVAKGYKIDIVSLNNLIVIKNYLSSPDPKSKRKGIGGNYYKVCNLYSPILKNKISFISPGMQKPPREVQSIHASHYGKICPVSIANQDPGELVSILPGVELTEFGMFKESKIGAVCCDRD